MADLKIDLDKLIKNIYQQNYQTTQKQKSLNWSFALCWLGFTGYCSVKSTLLYLSLGRDGAGKLPIPWEASSEDPRICE